MATALPVLMVDASPLGLLVMLVMGHLVGDFVLQHDRMAIEKCAGSDSTLPWGWWLAGHTACHGLIVALLTGVPLLGLAECLAHALIDWGKCRFRFSLGLDQTLHLLCKVVWVGLLSSALSA
jgi:hypothetical protein